MKLKIFSVLEVISYIKNLIYNDIILSEIIISGEISNCKKHISGHVYFNLKDSFCSINCVLFKNYLQNLNCELEDGMHIHAFGDVEIYEKTGSCQLVVYGVYPQGKGSLSSSFEFLKNKLQAEGLFDKEKKRQISSNPTCIAIITSITGSVLQDIINIARRRNPTIRLVVAPATVQGNSAKHTIIHAIKMVNLWAQADTIILCRGGGSSEDLSCFNEESVSRAIFFSKIPIVSAIGHETDFTLADFVADLRASTPSEAAEISIPDFGVLKNNLLSLYSNIFDSFYAKLSTCVDRLANNFYAKIKIFTNIKQKVVSNKLFICNQCDSICEKIELKLALSKNSLQNNITLLDSNSPLNILKRGYCLVKKDDTTICTFDELQIDNIVDINFFDGTVVANILKKYKNKHEGE